MTHDAFGCWPWTSGWMRMTMSSTFGHVVCKNMLTVAPFDDGFCQGPLSPLILVDAHTVRLARFSTGPSLICRCVSALRHRQGLFQCEDRVNSGKELGEEELLWSRQRGWPWVDWGIRRWVWSKLLEDLEVLLKQPAEDRIFWSMVWISHMIRPYLTHISSLHGSSWTICWVMACREYASGGAYQFWSLGQPKVETLGLASLFFVLFPKSQHWFKDKNAGKWGVKMWGRWDLDSKTLRPKSHWETVEALIHQNGRV